MVVVVIFAVDCVTPEFSLALSSTISKLSQSNQYEIKNTVIGLFIC